MNPPLFEQVLGTGFAQLPTALQALHSIGQQQRYAGRGGIRRGRHWLVAPCAWLARLPRTAADIPVEVEFLVDDAGERWHRNFGGQPMRSRLWLRDGRLHEQLGTVRFRFALTAVDGQILWRVERVWAFGLLPLPTRWFGGVRCREREHGGRYEFLVDVSMPWIGPLIRYEGWLEPR